MSGLGAVSSGAPSALPLRAGSSLGEFAKMLRVDSDSDSPQKSEALSKTEQREAPKLETILVHMLLKEAKLISEGDPRAPLAGQALVDHLVRSGAFDLGLGEVEP